MKLKTENLRTAIGEVLEFKWTTSRGRDTYGYNICTLRNRRGEVLARCCGGGYDMKGTCLGNWIARRFNAELCALKPSQFPKQSHWESARKRVCDGDCKQKYRDAITQAVANGGTGDGIELMRLPDDCFECPVCHGPTRDSGDGRTVQDGRSFYGLSFVDPHYDVLNEKLEHCDDTFTKPEDVGKTFRQLQKEGKIVDLDILRRYWSASKRQPSKRHNYATIDGACGFSSVEQILHALGLALKWLHETKKTDLYEVVEFTK